MWNWFISFHEFFGLDFFNFSGLYGETATLCLLNTYWLCLHFYREVEESPFVERLIKKGYEVLFLDEAVDEYCLSAIPEFEGKKFQNVAKDGFNR